MFSQVKSVNEAFLMYAQAVSASFLLDCANVIQSPKNFTGPGCAY